MKKYLNECLDFTGQVEVFFDLIIEDLGARKKFYLLFLITIPGKKKIRHVRRALFCQMFNENSERMKCA